MNVVVDMNLSPIWCDVLKDAGHCALHWSDVGPADSSDDEIMSWAQRNDTVILTADLDFSRILALSDRKSPSIVLMRLGRHAPASHSSILLKALERFAEELSKGAVLSIDIRRLRARLLPLSND
jgi:predicted nuclease of predicted toxin-antitoxin system